MRFNFYRSSTLIVVFLLFTNGGAFAQKNSVSQNASFDSGKKKYTSLLWEITGNGLSKPSYLFGTMHISNKLVFNLSDSFYSAIRNVDVVALEQNPEVWQEEWSVNNDDYDNSSQTGIGDYSNIANDRLTEQTFSISNYDAKLKAALASEARMVNGMLYRNNVGMEDFEEETYLDMYIYRLGRKLNKAVTGVEDYKQSNRLVREAYVALYKDKNRKQNGLNGYGDRKRMEDAYRRGDLDVLDSLQMLSIVSDAFQEKFMYRRNVIQANSIDTIIRHKSLFVGVGAAHLPGDRGVIELLRKKGYKLRPVFTGKRDSDEKDRVEKIRVPVIFARQFSEDSSFSVDVPGKKLYRYNSFGNLNMVQYADMGNGSYYMVTRIKTSATLLGQSTATVLKKVDSLLYENIPGKIVNKEAISKNGYSGFDIVNKTRKGDEQRYNIYVLPDEILIFKVSGISDYISDGKEADQFFSSISFTPPGNTAIQYQPPYGGFTADFPVSPLYIPEARNNRKRSEWLASDKKGEVCFIYKANIHQYDYVEADSFELKLMKESFGSTKVIKKPVREVHGNLNKYPFHELTYVHEDGSFIKARFLLQGNNYFVIGCKYKDDEKTADKFIRSFAITPFTYQQPVARKDTALGFTVMSPIFYKTNTDSNNVSVAELYGSGEDEDINSASDAMSNFSLKVIENDTSGEHIAVMSFKMPKYFSLKDSAEFYKTIDFLSKRDSAYILRLKSESFTSSKWLRRRLEYTDTGSSRILTLQSYYKNGVFFYLANQGDTITPASSFVKTFFETFEPADTFKTFNAFEKKSKLFFSDYFSSDSALSKKARRYLKTSLFDSSDLPDIKTAISRLSWKDKNYLFLKKRWIDIVGSFSDSASINYLAALYTAVKDTSDLQNALLDALLDMKTKNSFDTFKKLVLTDPPAILSASGDEEYSYRQLNTISNVKVTSYYGFRWRQLYDTLSLSSAIIPDLLDLMVLEDYKNDAERLLCYAVDSGYIKADQYKQYLTKFLLEAKQSLKKQIAKEDKAEMRKMDSRNGNNRYDDNMADYVRTGSSSALSNYVGLLIPFWETSPDVPVFFERILQLKNKRLRMDAVVAMIGNGRPVNDSIIKSIAADDKLRLPFYKALVRLNKLQMFPAAYKGQQQMALSILKNSSLYNAVDSIAFLDKVVVQQGKYRGRAYFYKYKKDKDDTEWQIAVSGLQPIDTTKVSVDEEVSDSDEIDTDRIFIKYADEVIKKDVPIALSVQKVLKKCLYALMPSSSRFLLNSNDNDDEESYMADAVKARRYE